MNRLDASSNQCRRVGGTETRSPIEVRQFPYIDKTFLDKNPFCSAAKTCLTEVRLQYLHTSSSIPNGINSSSFLTSEFKNKKNSACLDHEVKGNLERLFDLNNFLNVKEKTYPIETKMSYDLVQKTKDIVDTNLRESENAISVLKNCLRLNVEYESQASTSEEKLKLYKTQSSKNPKIQKGCERIWLPDSEIQQLRTQLTGMRQALFGLSLYDKKIVTDSDSLKLMANDLQQETPPADKRATQSPLVPIKGKLFDTFSVNSFWDQTPEQLEPLNDLEKKDFNSYLKILKKDYPQAIDYKMALTMDYFSRVSENPILIHFASARPDSRELLFAFEKYQEKLKKADPLKMDDMDYLNFNEALEATIQNEPPELRGDYCVLAAYMTRSRREHFEAPGKLFQGMILLEGGAAAWVAKGFGKKILAFVMGAKYSGSALSLINLEKSISLASQQGSLCSRVGYSGNNLCRLSSMEANGADAVINSAMLLVFGSRLSTRTKIGVPAALSGDSRIGK